MRVPISWLKEYVEITLPVEELAERLTIAGLEVENIEYIGLPGGSDGERLVWDREKLVLGHILEVEAHPNADRLVLATVEYGGEEPEVVVTGAPNLFPLVGQGAIGDRHLYSPFALEGAELYDGHAEGQQKMTLKGRELRGIHNRCMLLSEKELGLSEDHEGILLLQGEGYKPGIPIQDLIGDVVFDIAIIPNIARAASIIGVAREVAALTGQQVRYPDYDVVQEGPPVDGRVTISTERPDLNPRFVAMVIEGVEQKPSPFWMQHRLRLAGQRPINVVVDISNYVMLEMGEPNHAFDYDYLRRRADETNPDGPIHIITRLPHAGETVTTLDGVRRDPPNYTILVTDEAGPLSIGGIIGGEESEIGDGTTTVLLEAAAWNFLNIRRSMHTLKLNTEAGFRFSRGVHPDQAILGARRAAELMRRHAGGTVWQGIVDYYPNPPEQNQISFTSAEVARLGGIHPTKEQVKAILESLEFSVESQSNHLLVTPPNHRLDIEGAHDLVEEVCRIYGYDQIPAEEMSDTLPPQRNNPELEWEERIKDLLVQMGIQEVITYRLTTPESEARLIPPGSQAPPDDRPYITLNNPISAGRVVMRHSLLASLLETAAENSRFQERLALFEIGKIFLASEEGALPDEPRYLGLILNGPRQQTHWQNGDAPPAYDFFDLKGILEGLLAGLHIEDYRVAPGKHPTFRPGRTARLYLGERQVGTFGELHPLVAERLDFRSEHPVLAADLNLELLMNNIPDRLHVRPLPTYPAVHEDLALIVDSKIPAAEVEAAVRKAGGFLLQDVELFDLYEGEQIPAGKKSLAYHLSFQSPSKTLTDREVKRQRQRIIDSLSRQLDARLRE